MKGGLVLLLLFAMNVAMGDGFVVENDIAIMTVDDIGRTVSLRERESGRELVTNRLSFVCLRDATNRRRIQPKAVVGSAKEGWSFSFREVPGEVTVKIRSFGLGWIVRVERITVADNDCHEIQFARLYPCCNDYFGKALPMISDDSSGVIVFPIDLELGSRCGHDGVFAVTDHTKSVVGRHFGIIAAPRPKLRDALKALARIAGVPVSPRGGPWALDSEDNRLSTFFTDMTEDTVDDWLDYAKRGHFGVIHFSRWYQSLGTYRINRRYFPHGIEGISNVCDKVHAAGFDCGIHTLTGCLSVNEPLVAERIDDLATECEYTLARPFGPDDTELFVSEKPSRRHDLVLTYSSRGNVLRVGRELVQYAGIRNDPPYGFTGLKRGSFKTARSAVAVPVGAAVGYLRQRYMSFYPIPNTRLAGEIADNVARVFRAGRMDDIYHDGAEGLGSRYAVDAVRRQLYDRLGTAPFMECSSPYRPHGWWFQSRLSAWDHPRWAPKRFLDKHLAELVKIRKAELLPITTGWWEPRKANDVSRGHFMDEMEYFAAKNAAYDACTTIHSFDIRKGVSEYLRRQIGLFGTYEKFRLDRSFSEGALAMMRPLGAECRLRQGKGGSWNLTSVTGQTAISDGPSRWKFRFPSGGKAAMRVEALYAANVDSTNSVVLAHGGAKVEFPFPYRSLCGNAAFALTLTGCGSGNDGVLDVRLKTPREYNGGESDHYLPLGFDGTRTVTFLLRERDAERRAAEDPRCPVYSVMRESIDLKHLARIEFIPKGADGAVIGELRAVPVAKTSQVRPTVTVNGVRHVVPFTLVSGDWAELEEGEWRHWKENGELAGTAPAQMPTVVAGDNALSYEVESSTGGIGRAEVTLIAFGESIPALKAGKGLKNGR